MLYSAIEDAEEGDDYLFFAFITKNAVQNRDVYSFYGEFTAERKRRGIKVKGIASESSRKLFQKYMQDTSHVLFVKYPTLQNISIFRNKVIMTPWEDREVSFLITSRQLADNFRNYFMTIWKAYGK